MSFPLLTISAFALSLLATIIYLLYVVYIQPLTSPLRFVPGPPSKGIFGSHLSLVLNGERSATYSEEFIKKYGRNIRISGFGRFDHRLLTLDPVAINHVLNRSQIYQKPWQSRRLIESLIGCGLLASEGILHKRQRRVSNPAFSNQNLKALLPLFFAKAYELRDKWNQTIAQSPPGTKLEICNWISRMTFDVIGLAGFDYEFNAIHDETNEVYLAYKDMFETTVSCGQTLKSALSIYMPWIPILFPDEKTRIVRKSQQVIRRTGIHLVEEKKKALAEGKGGKDLLSLLLKSNQSTDIPPDQRISDDDILNQISTFLFAGSDTTSLAVTWTIYRLSLNPEIQTRLREEILSFSPSEDVQERWKQIDSLHYLDKVVKEGLRLIPPIHSSLRVAMEDDEIPVSEGVKMPDGSVKWGIGIRKGQFVHVAVEGFNLDREVWGEDAWEFKPDRWDYLPPQVKDQPGIFSNTMTFSAGPRSCIGVKFSLIEMKTLLYVLVSNFVFSEPERIVKVNVILTRPFVAGRYKASQCPVLVTPYTGA